MVEYSKTPEGQQYWKEDMSGVSGETITSPAKPQSSPSKSSSDSDIEDDPFNKMLKNMLMGSINPIPGI